MRIGVLYSPATLVGERLVTDDVDTTEESAMNLVDGLERVREMLGANGADPATLRAVDLILANADTMSGGSDARAQSLLQITKMLMRTPVANQDVRVYNDLAKIEQQLTIRAGEVARERAAEAEKPMPKSKKFYREQKERERAAKGQKA